MEQKLVGPTAPFAIPAARGGTVISRLFRTKSIEQILADADHPDHRLKKTLTAWDLTALGIGAIIGTGIFVLIGTAIVGDAHRPGAGAGIILSFVLSGLTCAFAALCYAEFSTMIPVAGSAYTFSYATLGEFLAWIIGWDLVLEYSLASATVSAGGSGYVMSFLRDFGIHIPARLSSAPYIYDAATQGWVSTGAVVNLPAVLIVALVTILLVVGIRESANVNTAIVFIKIGVIVTFILAGVAFVHRANWHPFIPPNSGQFGHYGWSGVMRGAAVVFVAYIGFDAVSTAAQEARNPQRDMPVGIIGSLIICTLLYILVAGVLTGMVPYASLNVPDPIAVGIDATKIFWLRPVIKIGAIAGLTSVILVLLYGQSRIFFTMSQDGLLPHLFAEVHPRLHTPYLSQIMIGAIVAVVAAFTPINVLGEMVSIGTLFAFILVC